MTTHVALLTFLMYSWESKVGKNKITLVNSAFNETLLK